MLLPLLLNNLLSSSTPVVAGPRPRRRNRYLSNRFLIPSHACDADLVDDYGDHVSRCEQFGVDFVIDPDSTDDFEFNLVNDLDGDTIESVDFILPDGLTEVSSSNTDTTATVMLTGASAGRTYRVTCRYTTEGGRTRDVTIRLAGRES